MSEENQKEICLYCKAWQPVTRGVAGECRRRSPVPQTGWYSTREHDWCLDFIDRPDDHTSDTTFEHIGDAAARVIGRIKPGDAA
jgi:hypothetical protein